MWETRCLIKYHPNPKVPFAIVNKDCFKSLFNYQRKEYGFPKVVSLKVKTKKNVDNKIIIEHIHA